MADGRAEGTGAPQVVAVSVQTVREPGPVIAGQLRVTHDGTDSNTSWPPGLLAAFWPLTDPNRTVTSARTAAVTQPAQQVARTGLPGNRRDEHPDRVAAQAQFSMNDAQIQLADMLGRSAKSALDRALAEGRQVRVEIAAPLNDPAMTIPWEYMVSGAKAVVLERGGLCRRVGLGAGPSTSRGERPEQLVASVLDLSRPLETEFHPLLDTLAGLDGIPPPSRSVDELGGADVVYVLGHGAEPDPAQDQPARVGGVDAGTLVERFDAIGWPELVVLLACRTAEAAASLPSFAGSLCDAGAPAVIGMAGDIEVIGIAPSFVDALWGQLRAGASLHAAVCAGRVAVANCGTLQQYGVPVLFTTVEDPLPALDVAEGDVPGRAELATRIESLIEIGPDAVVGGSVNAPRVTGLVGSVRSVIKVEGTVIGDVNG